MLKTDVRAVGHRHGDGSVELDDWRRLDLVECLVEGGDLDPVGVGWLRLAAM